MTSSTGGTSAPKLTAHPAPPGLEASKEFTVTANGTPIPVYPVRVREKTAMLPGITLLSHVFQGETNWAALGMFDFAGRVTVRVKIARPFKSVEIAPISLGIVPQVNGDEVSFELDEPRMVTLLLDGALETPLHLFTRPPEENPPAPDAPDVIYFGPGVHDIGMVRPKSGQTIYLASGAVLRPRIHEGEMGRMTRFGFVAFDGAALFLDSVKDVRIRGRGIVDCAAYQHPARQSVLARNCLGVEIEGITLLNAANWNLQIQGSRDVTVSGVGIISGRLNSDGINTVNSSNVRVSRCFVRNHDDSYAVKTIGAGREAHNILYEDCVAWSDWGYSTGVTYETRSNVHDVTFRNIDVIACRMWPIGVEVNDSGTVENIRFENIRIRNASRHPERHAPLAWIRLNIEETMWGNDKERGHVRNIVLDRVAIDDDALPEVLFEANGFDEKHRIEDVTFRGVTINGKPAASAEDLRLKANAFVHDLKFEPAA